MVKWDRGGRGGRMAMAMDDVCGEEEGMPTPDPGDLGC